ncbi:Tim10/DDP family zinc finger-domain-containing protein [Pisolithus croceorrhizus]|nr:Tim10/DDP family zinc finger-domain-containing protein [Pisolithus croceorrhizus]
MDQLQFDDATKVGTHYLHSLFAALQTILQKELATFLEREQAHARVNDSIRNLTGMCWDKCITSTPGSRFARGEESCLSNCVERFLDTSIFIVTQVQRQQQQLLQAQGDSSSSP